MAFGVIPCRGFDSGAADMSLAFELLREKSRLKLLLEHFSQIDDPREPWRVAHPLAEVLLLVVCATMADCDDYDAIAAWTPSPLGEKRIFRFFVAICLTITAFPAVAG
jgi:hypothetical protein